MRIASYCRVSTDKEDQLNSLEVQKNFFEEYAKQNNHILFKTYADEGISGTKIKNRIEFKKLMKDAEYGLFEMVVVKDISRFARNTVDLLNNTRKLKSLNIETLFITSNMTVLGNSEFVLTLYGALAQEESANISKRIKFSKKINAEKGKVPNIVYGYDKTIGDYFNLTINEFEANIIKRIFDMYAVDNIGQRKIADILNGESLLTKRKCQWSQNAISRILSNQIYIGKIINGKEEIKDFLTGQRRKKEENEWDIFKNENLRIINDDLFYKVQDIINNRNDNFKNRNTRFSNKNIFSTLIKCKHCSSSFRRIKYTYKNTFVKWVCNQRNTSGKNSCENGYSVDENELLEKINILFSDLLKNRNTTIKYMLQRYKKEFSQEGNAHDEKTIILAIAKIKKSKQKYINMYDNDIINIDDLKNKTNELNKELSELEGKFRLINSNSNSNKEDSILDLINKYFDKIDSVINGDNFTNSDLKLIIEKIEVNKNGDIEIILNIFNQAWMINNI